MSEGEPEQMLLHWNNFHTNLVARFHEFQQREELVDVTIAAKGGSVHAHRLLLSACSPYLKQLLEASPCDHPVLILKDVGHQQLLSILEFMYRGEVRVEQEDLEVFLQAAEMLQVKGLTGGQNKTQDDDDSTGHTTAMSQKSPTNADDNSDSEERVEGRRKLRAVRKRKRSENTEEQDCGASACKGARSDTSSSDDNSTGASDQTEFSSLRAQNVVLVDIDSDSDVEEVNAPETLKDKSGRSDYCDNTGSLYVSHTSDGLQLIQRQRGYPQLVYANFIFNCQLYEGSHVYWVCQDNYKFNCRASVVTISNEVINVYGARHNHDSHEREVEDEMLKGNFRVLPLRRDMFLDVHSGNE